MAGGTKRLPRAVREQQMLDAAVEVFSENGFHNTSMDAIAARAQISKPMLYLYYGSKDELFAACISREGQRFVEALTPAGDPGLTPRDQLRVALESFLGFVDAHRNSWMVLYRQAMSQQAFAGQVRSSRDRLIELTAHLLESSTRDPEPGTDFAIMAVALVGAGEAVADRIAGGEIDVEKAADLLENLAWRGLAGKKRTDQHGLGGAFRRTSSGRAEVASRYSEAGTAAPRPATSPSATDSSARAARSIGAPAATSRRTMRMSFGRPRAIAPTSRSPRSASAVKSRSSIDPRTT